MPGSGFEQAGAWLPVWEVTAAQLPAWLGASLLARRISAHSEGSDQTLPAARVEGQPRLPVSQQRSDQPRMLVGGDGLDAAAQVLAAVKADGSCLRRVLASARRQVLGRCRASCAAQLRGCGEAMESTLVLWALTRDLRPAVWSLREEAPQPAAAQAVVCHCAVRRRWSARRRRLPAGSPRSCASRHTRCAARP